MIEYSDMRNKDRKYIYYEDQFGFVIGYIDDLNPNIEDLIQVTIIAEKTRESAGKWITEKRNITIMQDLRRLKRWKFYETYEEFGTDFFEAIL